MIDTILGLLMILIFDLIFYAFLKACLKSDKTFWKNIVYLLVLVFINYVVAVVFSQLMPLKMLVGILTTILFVYFSFRVSIKKSILFTLFYWGMSTSSEMIVFLFIKKIDPDNKLSEMTNSSGGFVAELFSMLIVLIVVLMLSVFWFFIRSLILTTSSPDASAILFATYRLLPVPEKYRIITGRTLPHCPWLFPPYTLLRSLSFWN